MSCRIRTSRCFSSNIRYFSGHYLGGTEALEPPETGTRKPELGNLNTKPEIEKKTLNCLKLEPASFFSRRIEIGSSFLSLSRTQVCTLSNV